MLKYRNIKLEHLSSEHILNSDIINLINKVSMNVGKLPKHIKLTRKICPEWSIVELFTKNGESHEKFIGAPLGSSMDPLPRNMLYEKFKSCVEFSKIKFEAKSVYEKLINIEHLKNCQELLQ